MRLSKVFFITSIFAAFLSFSSAKATEPSDTDVIVKVNGHEITRENIDSTINMMLPLVTYHQTIPDAKYDEIRQKAIHTLIDNELIYEYAIANKLDKVDKKEVDKQLKEIRKKLPPGETLQKVLKRSNLTLDELKNTFKKNTVITKIRKSKAEEFKKNAETTVTEQFMKDYYNNNLNKFKEPERVHLSSILIKADPSGGQKVWNESKKKADGILELVKSGQDFAKLAQEHSEDPTAKDGGDMGWAHVGSISEEIGAAIEGVNTGEVVGPVMDMYGYHLVKIEERVPSTQKAFESLNIDKLKTELIEKEKKEAMKKWLKGLNDSAKVEYLEQK
ncbi:MAG TPA: hypothetical protein DDW94_04535 [Deltaproteobacteria bacterium]|nr:MAG: hypothetical protein A2Z79_12990 [Deltaproteobacteria bacterium GWA2_55_82]OGQ62791.1 MAG: hypothetical protein A3I81_11770 [Deltaproteobacteria bacterium RIFCSPLOWO2_02_FULL_55_12]OIJ73511.1 MAG: hypothetical protein A2V21_304060 [Deltaproteobacteria bacterium GWC2_55_46]HBG46241.1 hypothetical protein [Deltaproteobacteria bacterium]HCY10148.1 hypothetical protein [Deltaproteobacteria bacterium]